MKRIGVLIAILMLGTLVFAVDTKLEDMTKLSVGNDDLLLYVVNDPNGTAVDRKIPLDEMLNYRTEPAGITFIIDGGGSAITTGIKGDIEIPFDCTITRVTMLADQSGSIVVDLWVDSYANYPPTDADSVTASAVPTITTAVKSQDATLTGWTTAISAGDSIRYNVDSVTTIERCTISLLVTK